MEALAAWSAVGTMTPGTRRASQKRAVADGDLGSAADALAAAATSIEGEAPGPLSEAARRMARAAQEEPARRSPAAADIVRDMADTFLSIASAGSGPAGTLVLVREVARLADACAARAATATARREAGQASALVHASIATLTNEAGQQATVTLRTRGTGMTEPTHEDELLQTVTQAGVLAAQTVRTVFDATGGGRSSAMNAEIARLRRAGYTEHTPHDDLLRRLLGEQRWAWYETDKARIAAAAAITDAERTGLYDMEKLLTRAVNRRAWEQDPVSPAQSVAQILHYRVNAEVKEKHRTVMKQQLQQPQAQSPLTDRAFSPAPAPAPVKAKERQARPQPQPMPVTPYDDKLRSLLGEQRWAWYEGDPRRRDVAALLTKAAATGRDMDELLTKVVTMREFEKDPRSPARRVAAVLHYRIEGALAEKKRPEAPGDVAAAISNATAPVGTGPKTPTAQADAAHQRPPAFRPTGRPPEGREGR